MGRLRTLTAISLAAGVLTLGSGCLTTGSGKQQAKKPDVTQPGVLPPPQAMTQGAGGSVVPAGGIVPSGPGAVNTVAMAPPSSGGPSLAKLKERFERKTPATDMEVAWRNRIAFLPDPAHNGRMSPGLAGQMFLFGGPKLQFAEADGTLTVDLIDETPRPAGQPPATPERWQFSKEMLKNLRAMDETFGKSYVLFLPWPAYKPDITRVRISARYDPDNGHTLFAQPTVLTIDTSAPLGSAPVWENATNTSTPRAGPNRTPPAGQAPNVLPFGGSQPFGQPQPQPQPQFQQPIPIPAASAPGALPTLPAGGTSSYQPIPLSGNGPANAPPPSSLGPLSPIGATAPAAPTGFPEGVPPIAITVGR